MPNIKRGGSPTARPADRGSSTGLFRSGIATLASHQSATSAGNDTGKPTTPSDYHPAMPSPSKISSVTPKEGMSLGGAPLYAQEGLGGMLNSAFGCGPDDPGCNG